MAPKWLELGVTLFDQEKEHLLYIIQSDHRQDVKKCCLKMFFEWLETHNEASWSLILEALRSSNVELTAVADELERNLIMIGKNNNLFR